jgi:hypothetical protein
VNGVRRWLIVAAVVATLVGLPAVLLAGTLLRHVGHVSPAVTNATELRLRLLGHGFACDHPAPEPTTLPEASHVAATALLCDGPDGMRLRLCAYRNDADAALDRGRQGVAVSGANWRVEVLPPAPPPGQPARPPGRDADALADRIAHALTGRASHIVYRAG